MHQNTTVEFINLDISLEPRSGNGYPVLADSARFGQARAVCRLDVTSPDIAVKLGAIANDQLDGEGLTAFGQLLAANVITGQVEDLFNKNVGAAQAQPKNGVRIRLRINAPELNILPWELLQTESGHDPIGVSTGTVLTRYIEMNEPVREVEAPRPLRMLGIIPQGSGLDTDKEKAALEKAVAELHDALELKWLEGAVTRDRIRDALGEVEYHLVHFIGHGSMDGNRASLRLNDEYGDDYPVPAETFSGLFRDSSVRLVVLNACRGAARAADNAMKGVAPQVVRRGVPAVVAMQWDIHDRAAQQFAKSFYRCLCIGPEAGEVDTAVTKGRAVLYDDWPGSKAFATPVLFLRAEDGRLWKGEEREETDVTGEKAAPSEPRLVQNIGTQISGSNISGDVTFGNKITTGANSNVVIAEQGANVNIGEPASARGAAAGTAYATLVTQLGLWQNAIGTSIEGLPGLSPDEKRDLKDQVGKIRLEAIKKQMDTGRLTKLINTLGVMGGNELVELTVKRLAGPLARIGVTLTMNTDFRVSVNRVG